ncbi:MAG: hypothetical protein NTY53_20400 [Kiritimatiellaeota bacterium]|nr:hypothetical protein [Kiritimatiellota bacterium]
MSATHPTIKPEDLEKYSSALTLSDMEIFIYPELLFSLVLANIMSPKLWAWRDDPWFAGLHKMTPYRRILRLKQFIIDHYTFNLDLDTWGLTTKEREMARFSGQLNEAALAQSNALFGYEGDKYYFDLDIRKHFGLDKYTSSVIPYWKTETIEAMDAFRFKEGYPTGAGECVSLSTLYAAAMFVVCGIPLEDIFLLATPLHSQNYILVNEGVLTNNRRLVTKNMWFNGTELTDKAQRALRHEQITVVSHISGHVHCLYLTMEILLNFLRQYSSLQSCFQLRHDLNGHAHYIPVEKVYAYEHASTFKISDDTRSKLLDEMDEDEFFPAPMENRILLNKFDEFFKQYRVNLDKPEQVERLMAEMECNCTRNRSAVQELLSFARLEPRLPGLGGRQHIINTAHIALAPTMTREDITAHLAGLRGELPVADLAFYAFRDLASCDAAPFLKAALERSPVSIKSTEQLGDDELVQLLEILPNESIYDGARFAQPDEVWNYRRGDGLERALLLANIWRARHPQDALALASDGAQVTLKFGTREIRWPTVKTVALDATL